MTTLKERFNIDTAKETLPVGSIVVWSGTIATVPINFGLCDGTNGTPDLRDKFVIGAGNLYSPTNTGGSKDAEVIAHTHTGTTASNGSHSHTASTGSAGSHGHTGSANSAGNHRHSIGAYSSDVRTGAYVNADEYSNRTNYTDYAGAHTHTLTINSAGAHTHTVTVNSNGAHTHTFTTDSTGVAGLDKNLPPYYALAFIMRLQ